MLKHFLQLLLCATPLSLAAQDCATLYDYLNEGVLLEYTNYDKKGKVQSVSTQTVRNIEQSSDTTIATIDVSSVNEKGKDLYENSFPIKCHAGVIYMDMRSVIPQQSNANQSAEIEVEIQGTDLTYPPDMKPGQNLSDSEIEVRMRMGSIQIMNTRYTISNRKVEARETVTTAAGTFDCLKISYDFEYKLMGTRTIHTEMWYAPAVGMVKSINYDKKGNADGKTELTSFKK